MHGAREARGRRVPVGYYHMVRLGVDYMHMYMYMSHVHVNVHVHVHVHAHAHVHVLTRTSRSSFGLRCSRYSTAEPTRQIIEQLHVI